MTHPDPMPAHLAATFHVRTERYSAELLDALVAVYGEQAPALHHRVLGTLEQAFRDRPQELRDLDEQRLLSPDWLQDPAMIGYVTYADRFGGTLAGVADHLDHLADLGVRYLHLMPLLKPREGENDGGYAVADYRQVAPRLGTMADLSALAGTLRGRGIALVVDLVVNHVAREHEWAARARAGEQRYRDYFLTFPDRAMPDAYEATLPEIFPDFAPGSFSYDPDLARWVWTTFNSYQWDLNWANPEVFGEFVEIICFLANAGVQVLRLDAIAFIWKRLGTDCQGQPEVHHLTRALRTAMRIVAPAVAFKAEAIVGPEKLLPYLGQGVHWGKVSDMAYHNSLMVQLWSSLASRDTRLFEVALSSFPAKPPTTTWATYVHCHDDIGWAVSDADAARAGLDGPSHRRFLSDFYSGQFGGSFARGLVFQLNPATYDRRISGSCASLAGLELALEAGDPFRVDDAIGRILLAHAVILGFGGVPLLYLGDEIGMLNDYGFAEDPDHADDNRWVHRPAMDWAAVEAARADPGSPAGRILAGLRHLIGCRTRLPQLHAAWESTVLPSPDPRLLLLRRDHPEGPMVQVYNFSEAVAELDCGVLRDVLGTGARDALGGQHHDLTTGGLRVAGYQGLWLVGR